MNSNRLNSYALPHKGLRNALSKVSFLAGSIDVSNPYDLEKLKTLMNELVYLLETHAHTEDTIFLPMLEFRVPGGAKENMDEHILLESQIERLAQQLNRLTIHSEPFELAQFYADFSDFHSAYLSHMLMEEQEVQQLFWDNFSDEELLEMHHQILASFTPEKVMRWFRFIIPALTPTERLAPMSGIKANAPLEFFESLMEMLSREMPDVAIEEMRIALEELVPVH